MNIYYPTIKRMLGLQIHFHCKPYNFAVRTNIASVHTSISTVLDNFYLYLSFNFLLKWLTITINYITNLQNQHHSLHYNISFRGTQKAFEKI